MPRFVILEHDHPFLHWDLMLETGNVLRTWRLERPPLPGSGPIPATSLGDHRLMYLDYEGPVSGNRGRVVCWDRGAYVNEKWSDEFIHVRVHGGRVTGMVTLEWKNGDEWSFELLPDQ